MDVHDGDHAYSFAGEHDVSFECWYHLIVLFFCECKIGAFRECYDSMRCVTNKRVALDQVFGLSCVLDCPDCPCLTLSSFVLSYFSTFLSPWLVWYWIAFSTSFFSTTWGGDPKCNPVLPGWRQRPFHFWVLYRRVPVSLLSHCVAQGLSEVHIVPYIDMAVVA